MLLTIGTTRRPATDLGYLLHKNPANLHRLELPFGVAHGFYPEADEARCTFALLLDIDAVALVRGDRGKGPALIDQYVNDRPYAASSFLSVAIARSLRTAMGGTCRERPELAGQALPLTATVTPVALRGSPDLPERLLAPLGYRVTVAGVPLDETMPAWGEAAYASLTVEGTVRLADLLNHLYVLIPVLDRAKHYYVARDEMEKLLAKGEGWLARHPERELVARRYLQGARSLAEEAIVRLAEEGGGRDGLDGEACDAAEAALEQPIRLHDLRLDRVAEVLAERGCRKVADLGCGEGRLIRRLLADKTIEEVIGLDVSSRSLEIAARRLGFERMPERQRRRVRLLQGALTYRDRRLEGVDAVALVEVIEHLEPDGLEAMERAVLGAIKPRLAIVTTPNREYNARFPGLAGGGLRHSDHRFEWTRAELRQWAEGVAARHGYRLTIEQLGEPDPGLGGPSQMAILER